MEAIRFVSGECALASNALSVFLSLSLSIAEKTLVCFAEALCDR